MKIFLIFLAVYSFNVWAQDGVGKLIYVSGGVQLVSAEGESSLVATTGMAVNVSQTIVTEDDGLAILRLEDQSTIKIDPSSEVEISSLILKKQYASSGSSSFFIRSGGMMVKVVEKVVSSEDEDPPLEIKNDYVAFGVRGTQFYVGIDDESNNMWTSVKEGKVQALNFTDDDSEEIGAGKSMAVENRRSLTRPDAFDWSNKLNWNMDSTKKGELRSNFKKFQEQRHANFKERRSKLRERKRNSFKDRLKDRYNRLNQRNEKHKGRFQKARERIKERRKINKSARQDKRSDRRGEQRTKRLQKPMLKQKGSSEDWQKKRGDTQNWRRQDGRAGQRQGAQRPRGRR